MSAADGRSRRSGWLTLVKNAPSAGRVLVIDDEREIRESLKKLVSHFGYTVKVAASAEEGDAWMSAERFDVLLLDMELPRMKGPEFLTWALGRDPELAVIILTGLDDPKLAIECMDRGARSYLVKPVEAEFLRLALRDALSVRSVLVERNNLVEGGDSTLPPSV